MDYLWRVTDYLMDFDKVRKFQDLCGLKEAENDVEEKAFDRCCSDKPRYEDQELKQRYTEPCSSGEQCQKYAYTQIETKQQKRTCKYRVENWFLYYLFRFGSTLGHEVFYTTFIPFVFLNVDPYIGRKMVVVWVVTMYIGQALKDLIQWPRPTSPPVFKLEKRVDAEYGIPSTHAIAGTAFPFSILMSMYGRYDFPLELGIVLACCWCLLVGISRLYVGMHSILDVIAGITIAAVYLWLGWPFMDMVEDYTVTSAFAPLIIVMSHFLLGVFYPSTDHYSTSRGDTVMILAVGAGVHCVSHLHYQYGMDFGPTGELPYPVVLPSLYSMFISLARMTLCLVVVLPIRLVIKSLSLSLVCHAVGVSKNDRRSTERKDVEVTYKFITYMVVTIAATGIAPVFEYIGLTH